MIPVGYRFYKPLIDAAAEKWQLDPILVAAMCWQESTFNTDGFRFEADFYNRYLKPRPEWVGSNPRRVSSSYGLMQIMFPVAVERGYPKEQAPEGLFVPEVGLEFGNRQLRYMMDKVDAKVPQAPGQDRLKAALASYNGGFQTPATMRPDTRAYAESVLRRYATLQVETKT